jgi:acyl-CoA thioesterase
MVAAVEPGTSSRYLYDRDATVPLLGIELLAADETGATVRMAVRAEMCNGFGMIHGGFTFLLADSAMAFASNGDDDQALATSAGIDFFAPARVGQVLTATARRCGGGRKSVVWDVEVTSDDGTVIAQFRGRTRRLGTPIITD